MWLMPIQSPICVVWVPNDGSGDNVVQEHSQCYKKLVQTWEPQEAENASNIGAVISETWRRARWHVPPPRLSPGVD